MPQIALAAGKVIVDAALAVGAKVLTVEGGKALLINAALAVGVDFAAQAMAPACMPPGSPPWEPSE